MNRNLAFLFTSLSIAVLATPVKAESTLDKIQRKGVLTVAIREDAAPFGYVDGAGKIQGYCLDFFALLEQQLIDKLERNTLSIKLLRSTVGNRFNLLANNRVDLECGPNTIRSDVDDGVTFSNSFFITGTQFLVNKDNKLNLNGSLNDTVLGVVGNTSTEKFIAQRYPNATLSKYRGVTARTRAIQAVEQRKIDAMISDGILLRAEAQQQQLSSRDYPLIPKVPLSCDRYGMIIRSDDPDWQEFINSVIDSPKAEALETAWFGRLFDYTQPAENFCK